MQHYSDIDTANAIGGTFAVFPTAQNQTKNSKRATKPTHHDRHEMTTSKHDRKEGRSANTRLAQWGLTWFIGCLCFYFKFVLADNLVFQNPPLRQAWDR